MERYSDPKLIRDRIRSLKMSGKRVGFVPTMGGLHEGHLSLARTLREKCDIRVCSIFVNPTQFNDKKDFEAYLIDVNKDIELLTGEGVDIVFTPHASDIYLSGAQTFVDVKEISAPLEGAHRPGHFQGVATVVSLLFHIVEPDVAIFGEKDFQQLRLIEQMVRDLHMPIEIVRGKLVRDPDGLAMSTRNKRLSPSDRELSLSISRGLNATAKKFSEGERSADVLRTEILKELEKPGIQIEYVEIAGEDNLAPLKSISGPARALVAVKVGGVRLIDNVGLQ